MSETNGATEAAKEQLYKKLARLNEELNETLVVVEEGKPKNVIVPYEKYEELKKGSGQTSKNIKGLILAGGNATRLRPLTWVTNKHLLPIYDRPMIFYPLQAMQQGGVKDVLLTTNPHHAGDFINLLGTGEEFDLNLQFTTQKTPGGIAQAIALAEGFAENSPIMVILGDNIFDFDLKPAIERFKEQGSGARIFAMPHPDPRQYGVVEIDQNGRVISIEEKPEQPKSNFIAIGIYMFYPDVFEYIKNLKPSGRGELEITELIDCYRERGDLYCEVIDKNDWWVDAGTSHDELFSANVAAAERALKQKKEKLTESKSQQNLSQA